MVAPDAPEQLLATLLSTPQLANTPLGPCRITWAHSFEEGMVQLASRPYEACLVDSGLGPGCIAFLRAARTQGWRRPLILCTAVGEHDMQAAAQAAGASDILSKASVSLNSLGRLIQAAIQRCRFEETLRFGEEMVRILVEGTRDYAIYMLDREGRILTWNQGAERITGYSSLEVLGHHCSMLFTAEDRAALKPAYILRHAVSHGRYEEEGLRVRKDGSQFWAHAVVTPLYGQDGELRGFSKVSRDITEERKRMGDRARQAQRSAEAFRSSPLGSSISRMEDGTILDVNDAFCRLFGYKREELVGHRSTEFAGMWPDASQRNRIVEQLKAEGGYKDLELAVRDREGRPKWVRVSASRLVLDGEPCIMAVTEDVTASHERAAEAMRREARMQQAERMAGMGSWEWEVGTDEAFWSPNMFRLLGIEPNGAPARISTYLRAVHPDDRESVLQGMREQQGTPGAFDHTHRILRADGRFIWVRVRGAATPAAPGQAVRLAGTVQDVTTEVQAREVQQTSVDATVQEARRAWSGDADVVRDPRATRVGPMPVLWRQGPKLILVKGFNEGAIFPLEGPRGSWLIGRGAEVQVSLAYDPYVSRCGAEVRREGEQFLIKDMAPAKNGTFVNGRRLQGEERASLQDGDIVSIGHSLLVFRKS